MSEPLDEDPTAQLISLAFGALNDANVIAAHAMAKAHDAIVEAHEAIADQIAKGAYLQEALEAAGYPRPDQNLPPDVEAWWDAIGDETTEETP